MSSTQTASAGFAATAAPTGRGCGASATHAKSSSTSALRSCEVRSPAALLLLEWWCGGGEKATRGEESGLRLGGGGACGAGVACTAASASRLLAGFNADRNPAPARQDKPRTSARKKAQSDKNRRQCNKA
jgi:hypothetical protein